MSLRSQMHLSAIKSVLFIATILPSSTYSQALAPFTAPVTVSAEQPRARGFSDLVDRVQHLYQSPITFEEVPFENSADLKKVVIQHEGGPKTVLVNPPTDFNITLDQTDATPYLAAQSLVSAYRSHGLPGSYSVVQQNDRVDIVPTEVLGANGSMRSVHPLMSSPINLPLENRTVEDTLELLVAQVAHETNTKVVLLEPLFRNRQTVELSANGESAADVITNIGAQFHAPISFQFLYDADDKTYYLNIQSVTPPNVPGTWTRKSPVVKLPTTGPANSPYFTKDNK